MEPTGTQEIQRLPYASPRDSKVPKGSRGSPRKVPRGYRGSLRDLESL